MLCTSSCGRLFGDRSRGCLLLLFPCGECVTFVRRLRSVCSDLVIFVAIVPAKARVQSAPLYTLWTVGAGMLAFVCRVWGTSIALLSVVVLPGWLVTSTSDGLGRVLSVHLTWWIQSCVVALAARWERSLGFDGWSSRGFGFTTLSVHMARVQVVWRLGEGLALLSHRPSVQQRPASYVAVGVHFCFLER